MRKTDSARHIVQGNGEGSAAERTRTTITSSLKKKLADLMHEFTTLRNNIMNQYRDVVDRRYYTVTGEKASDEQIDQLIETGEAENLFQKAILAQGRGRVRCFCSWLALWCDGAPWFNHEYISSF